MTRSYLGRNAVVNGEVPLVVCVTADVAVRERVVRRLDDCGTVVICTDLAELRAMLFPPVPTESPAPTAPIVLGDLVVDVPGHLVTWQGEPLALTRLERELLARLAAPPVVVWTYERLFGSVWGGAYLGDTAILHSAVKRLRRKLRGAGGGLEIQTVRGVGYRLATPASPGLADDPAVDEADLDYPDVGPSLAPLVAAGMVEPAASAHERPRHLPDPRPAPPVDHRVGTPV
jgi:two-component system, OmpR family, response regulator MtrA